MSLPPPLPDRLRSCVFVLAALFAFGALAPQARAQDPFLDFFGGLFGGRRAAPHRPAPAGEPRVRRMTPQRESQPPNYWRKIEKPRRAPTPSASARRGEGTGAPAVAAKPAAPAVPPTFYVATLGDTLGLQLAGGLAESFPDHPEIGVLSKAKDSSGLVRDDFYDWIKAAREIAAGTETAPKPQKPQNPQKPNVAVVMIGSNDRQPIRSGGETLEPLSDGWRTAYAARVDALLAAFREKNIPVVWVGLPTMKNERFSDDMDELNEIFRARAAAAGQAYIDLREALADESGDYSAFGPDINGEIVKLRTADGVHLTEAGARAVAHFVAAEVKNALDAGKALAGLLGSGAPAAGAGQAAAAKPEAPAPGKPIVFRPPVSGPAAAPSLPDRPAIGPIQTLGESGETELARRTPPATSPQGAQGPQGANSAPVAEGVGAPNPAAQSPAAASAAQALVQHVLVEGGDQPARRNRADDARWPVDPNVGPPAEPPGP